MVLFKSYCLMIQNNFLNVVVFFCCKIKQINIPKIMSRSSEFPIIQIINKCLFRVKLIIHLGKIYIVFLKLLLVHNKTIVYSLVGVTEKDIVNPKRITSLGSFTQYVVVALCPLLNYLNWDYDLCDRRISNRLE